MSIHKSLVPASKLKRHRNVLSRDERIIQLEKEERWKEGMSYFGLAKVKNIKIRAKAKKKEEKPAEGAAAAPGAAPVAGAPATAGAPAKGAAPATGAAKPTAGAPAKGATPAPTAAKPAEKKK